MKKLTTEEFIQKARIVHGDKYNYPYKYNGNRNPITIECKIHGEFDQMPSNHLNGFGCKKCSEKYNYTTKEYIKIANEKHDNKYKYKYNSEYTNSHCVMKIICPIHGEFEKLAYMHLQGQGCQKCSNENKGQYLKKTFNYFIEKARKIHGNKYSYNYNEFINMRTPITIKCNISEHGDFILKPSDHINSKQGCPKCAGFYKTYKDLIKLGNKIHNYLYKYPDIYKDNFIKYDDKIEVICSYHGSFYPKLSNHLNNKTGCPKCNLSKGELKIENLLVINNIQYKTQKKFKNCKDKRQLPFDFYLPELNICIEYDGEQHFKVIEKWGGKDALILRQKRDNIKNKFCQDNNIKLIRIKYDENIEEKLKDNNII